MKTIITNKNKAKKAKKAPKKAAARAKKAAEDSAQPVEPPNPSSLTEEDAVNVNTDAEDSNSDISDITCEVIVADSTTEETHMAMPVVEQKEKLRRGTHKKAAACEKKLATRGDTVVDNDSNTAIVTAAITEIVSLLPFSSFSTSPSPASSPAAAPASGLSPAWLKSAIGRSSPSLDILVRCTQL